MPFDASSNAWLLRIQPRQVVSGALVLLAGCWTAVVLIDVGHVAGVPHVAAWWLLFANGHPIEWVQWFVLAAVTVSAARLSAYAKGENGPFLLLLAVGAALMLIEDAGDIRHAIAGWGEGIVGGQVAGLPSRMLFEVPYLAALATVPLYALMRHGRTVCGDPAIRKFVAGSYGLYAVAAAASGFRALGYYEALGRRVDQWTGGRLVVQPFDAGRGHHLFVDSLFEETVELLAAAFLLALVTATGASERRAVDNSDGLQAFSGPTRRPRAHQDERGADHLEAVEGQRSDVGYRSPGGPDPHGGR
jgi:hypothetical protein